jgi:hypothetical protein
MQPQRSKQRSADIQVKLMGVLTLLFVGGVVAYSVLPEGAVRGVAMTLITGLTIYSLFGLFRD